MKSQENNLNELVIEIIQHLKKGPFVKIVPATINDLAGEAIPISDFEQWRKKSIEKFNRRANTLLEKIENKLKEQEDVTILFEQYQKINDALILLKQNKMVSDNGWNFEVDQADFQKRIELVEVFKSLFIRRFEDFGGFNAVAKTISESNRKFNYDELDNEINVAGLKLNINGVDLAFLLFVFRKAGYLEAYDNKDFKKFFIKVLNNNIEVNDGKKYLWLKNFNQKISRAKSFAEARKTNLDRKEDFQDALKKTIKKFQNAFLENDEAFDIYGY